MLQYDIYLSASYEGIDVLDNEWRVELSMDIYLIQDPKGLLFWHSVGLQLLDDPVRLVVFVVRGGFQIRNHFALDGCFLDFLVRSQVFVFLFDFVYFPIGAFSDDADHLILIPLWFGWGRGGLLHRGLGCRLNDFWHQTIQFVVQGV